MISRKIILGLALLCAASLSAQTIDDALRYSFIFPEGTARFLGSAGGISPIGIDHTVAMTNPAGLGWARRNSASLTFGTQTTDLQSTLLNDPDNEPRVTNQTQFNIPAFGVVFAGQTRSLNWPTVNFAVTFNRLADYNEVIEFRGRSPNSLVQSFADDANNGFFNDFRNELASATGALLRDDLGFFTDFESNPDGQILRAGTVTRSGSLSELGLSVAGSFKDAVMWGLTLGIPFSNYEETRDYQEDDEFNQILAFEDLAFQEELSVDGAGINFKLGVIIRPTQALRISLAAHTPTFWTFNEQYETSFTYFFTEPDTGEAGGGTALSPLGDFRYNLRTPWRFLGGLGVVIGRKGFLGFELDYSQFQGNEFSFEDFTVEATDLNLGVENSFTSSLGLRLGGSLNLNPFQVSLGAGARQSAIVDDDELYYSFGLGVGYRIGDFFADLGYQYRTRLDFFQPYPDEFTPQIVELDYREHNVALTFGVQF
ncbi:MAG: hypothetical protein AAGF87_00545 [Bacteroidota bacterium]